MRIAVPRKEKPNGCDRAYRLGVELDGDHCRKLRRLVHDLSRSPDEVVTMALDLFWVACLNGKDLPNDRDQPQRRGRFVRQSSNPTPIAKCVNLCRDAMREL